MPPTARTPREAAPAPAPAPAAIAADLPSLSKKTPSPSPALNLPRQQPPTETATIPSYYGSLTSGPDPGAVAGITLGSVAAFILLLWLVYTCINLGNPNSGSNDTSTVVTEGTGSVYTRRNRGQRSRSRRASRRGTGHKETVEIRRGSIHARGGPVIVEAVGPGVSTSDVDRVIIEERRRSVSRHRASMPPPPPRRVAVSSSGSGEDDDDEDEVVVIEEHSLPPSRRHRSRVRSVERRSSGFREVDPERFAGGDASFVEVRRSGSRR
ncbi:hypothetical protein C8A01DRAFT_50759 [Parachaetomium inaequale]|uniref:Uncharacterized protein n=1 Tax=Parachaetomium inaequale TaxID=2588326 RepID=A0AAN6P628_9PEZI|nr:hypothetical protein C8A01DRAFT_50759 [Parachaetomium inaequale]